MPHQIDETMRDCIEECQVCFALCTETTQHCLEMGGAHAERTHIRTLIDCAEACQSAAAFMLRSSPLHASTCGSAPTRATRAPRSASGLPATTM